MSSSPLLGTNDIYEFVLNKHIVAIDQMIKNSGNKFHVAYEMMHIHSMIKPIVKATIIGHYAPRGYTILDVGSNKKDGRLVLEFIFTPNTAMPSSLDDLDTNNMFASVLNKHIVNIDQMIQNSGYKFHVTYEMHIHSMIKPIVRAAIISHYAPRGYTIMDTGFNKNDGYLELDLIFTPTAKSAAVSDTAATPAVSDDDDDDDVVY